MLFFCFFLKIRKPHLAKRSIATMGFGQCLAIARIGTFMAMREPGCWSYWVSLAWPNLLETHCSVERIPELLQGRGVE